MSRLALLIVARARPCSRALLSSYRSYPTGALFGDEILRIAEVLISSCSLTVHSTALHYAFAILFRLRETFAVNFTGGHMTRRLRGRVWGAAAAALVMSCAASESFAVELGDLTNYVRGSTQGLPLGVLPPPGLYGGFSTGVTDLGSSPGKGNQSTGVATNPVFGFGQSLLWVPGWTFLGASYGASIVQGEYFATFATSVNPPFAGSGINGPELINTNFTPISLSWTLGPGWFFGVGLTIAAPDGSQWASTASDVNINPDYWTFAPGWALSYIDVNWLLSANFRYDINTASRGVTLGAPFLRSAANGFISGNELFGDLTALYKIGKWRIGPVA
jgi:hypothetical protein